MIRINISVGEAVPGRYPSVETAKILVNLARRIERDGLPLPGTEYVLLDLRGKRVGELVNDGL